MKTRLRMLALAAVLAVPLSVVSTAPAFAVDVGTLSDLQTAIDAGPFPVSVSLSGDITALAGENLSIPTGAMVTLDLAGHALTIASPSVGDAAIHVPAAATLIIGGSGGGGISVTSDNGAGIGGNDAEDGGSVVINGGTIVATSIDGGAGIGGGLGGNGGAVTINGGTVTATGGYGGAGIGGGNGAGEGGVVTIRGGAITATGGFGGAGIGGAGGFGAGGTATVYATRTSGSGGTGGAAFFGGGEAPSFTDIPTTGVTYTANTTNGTSASTNGAVTIQFHYLVTFVSNGGSSTPDRVVDAGGTATSPTVTRDGYAFTDWHNGSASGPVWNFSDPVTGPMNMFAGWSSILPPTGAPPAWPVVGGGISLLLGGGILFLIARRRKSANAHY